MHPKERAIDDYAKEGLRLEVRSLIAKEKGRQQSWISAGFAAVFVVYVGLALWIGYIVNDVKVANDLKKEVVRQEMRTDSLKREMLKEFDKKYSASLNAYYNKLNEIKKGASNTKGLKE